MIVIIGNPDNRRVALFAAEAARAGVASHVVAWRDVIARPECLLAIDDRPLAVRIDAWGEDLEVERALLRRGARAATDHRASVRITERAIAVETSERGRIVAPRQAHDGALAVLTEIEQLQNERPRWRWPQPIAAIRLAFDKAATHRMAHALGVPVPEALPEMIEPEQLLAELARRELPRAYVKVGCGSSASCLALIERARTGVSLVTSLELQGERLYNSLRVRRYARPEHVERILRFLLGEGAHVEHAIDKLPSRGRHADVRFVVIRGQAPFAVLRTSRIPITNLHLGGARGDVQAYRERLSAAAWAEAVAMGERMIEALDAWHLGLDVAFERGTGRPYLLEVNAFGDLLPGLTRDGESVHAAELRALHRWA